MNSQMLIPSLDDVVADRAPRNLIHPDSGSPGIDHGVALDHDARVRRRRREIILGVRRRDLDGTDRNLAA
jgi:hypothetical protein